ncbi:MAG: SRPBCC family protein [Actinomycetota bacterium]|nr:SRPBCC family protein [Actinomycetota bacterium]
MTFGSRHISVSIDRPADDVYAFVSDPRNLPRWAAGLGGSIELVEGEWIAQSPMGRIKVAFADENELGVLDHDVTVESGETFSNPMRVVPNHDGSEVVFTLYRRPEMSAEEFDEDARVVLADLRTLKGLLEGRSTA